MDTWLITLIVVEIFFLAFILWLVANYRMNKLRQRSEERLRILERFTSSENLSEFLNTPSGSSFAHLFSASAIDPRGVIISAAAVGCFLLFLGIGLYVLEWVAELGAFELPAGLCIVLGLAVLLSAGVSHVMNRTLHRPGRPDAASPGHAERT